jgi:exonuclease III
MNIQPINLNNNPPPSQHYSFHVSTLNVQGLNSQIKQQQLIDMMDLEHISILGLSETKIPHHQSNFVYKHLPSYTTYFNNESSSPMGSGVGLIISNDYAHFVHIHKGYKGRVYHVDLFMKGHVKLRIIQTYFHANTSNNQKNIEELYSYVFNLLDFARSKDYHVILMGDFNISYEKYKEEYKRKGSYHWSYDVLHQIKHKYNMKDAIKLYHQLTSSFPLNTHFPRNTSLSPTRIDFIWISRSLVLKSINSGSFTPQYFNTDHNALYISFLHTNLGVIQKPIYVNIRSKNASMTMILWMIRNGNATPSKQNKDMINLIFRL